MLKNGGQEPVDPHFGASESYFNKAYSITLPVRSFYDKMKNNGRIMGVVDRLLPDSVGNTEDKLRLFFMMDVLKCYRKLGHDATNISTKEGLSLIILESYALSNVDLNYNNIQSDSIKRVVASVNSFNKTVVELAQSKEDDFFHLKGIFNACGLHSLVVDYFSLLYRLFSVIAKADDTITPEESRWLEQIMSFSQSNRTYEDDSYAIKDNEIEWKVLDEKQQTSKMTQSDPTEELQSLIGLSEVKEEVSALANFVKIQQEREKKGMKAVGLSYHCVFTGNPGTGKTTVARILAEIYRNLGILKRGHLVETDRSGLVAEYVGQTAVKTNKIIDSALDGVLFIDEAYSLVQGGGNDYGQEAISTLLKRMEDDRNRLIVVLAGYSEDMKRFIDSNPGLQSRFNRYIHFADYTADELKQIFLLNVDKNQYLMEPEGEELLSKILNFAIEHKDKNFGNGRYVRNLFEKTIQNQAIRLSGQPNITVEELSKLKAEDLPTNK
jgi:SpoVK/Ycf46/Vps4 family AAA+-type ATPase